jgi:hydroxymethylbilane synthase
VRIATRSSKLALKQVDIFTDLFKTQKIQFEIKKQITEGDRKSKKGQNLFDKAHFVEDLETSLLNNEADIAIHSLKDMSCHDTDRLEIYAAIEHQSRSDVLVYKDEINLNDLANIKIGTSSLRRTRQCKHFLKNNNCSEIRGNIDTRLLKLHENKFDAIILAKAGIERLGLNVNYIDLDFLPAIGQGIIAVQCRSDDKKTKNMLDQIKNFELLQMIEIERRIVRNLNATCNSALSIKSEIDRGIFQTCIEIYGDNKIISEEFSSDLNSIDESIKIIIDNIIEQGGLKLLDENY